MFSKILIANRGEIACRIIKTCRRLGIKTVAIHSDADSASIHTRLADQRVPLGGSEAKDTYLNIEKIVAACLATGAEAVHPGYGFLSENPEFARALAKAKITFIGPRPETIELMGDKVKAKEFAKQCSAPLIPGISNENEIQKFIKAHGFPILIKAAAGGGGRGMRKVYSEKEIEEAIKGAKREAEAFFKDGRIFVEKLIENGRHIEVQMFGDSHGNGIHLFDRDCTAQRRHQKVLEEAPAYFVPPNIRKDILATAERLCRGSQYLGAGTAEFLLAPDGKFYFLEVNSRLQVEHPVTESVLGLDLVELQIRVAAGEKLPNLVDTSKLTPRGFAIEARVCAESPEENFMTSTGQILKINAEEVSKSLNVRIDTGFGSGDIITHYYDSLLAKVIAHGETRPEAIQKCQDALRNLHILGIKTNIPFLLQILESSAFSRTDFHVNEAESLLPSTEDDVKEKTIIGALHLLSDQFETNARKPDVWSNDVGWRMHTAQTKHSCVVNGKDISFLLENLGRGNFRVLDVAGSPLYSIGRVSLTPTGSLSFLLDGRHHGCKRYVENDRAFLATHKGTYEIGEFFPKLKSHRNLGVTSNELKAPFPGKIVSIKCKAGSMVEEGDTVLIMESMKMEHPLKAPLAAKIQEVTVQEGDVIEAGKLLARLSFS